MKLRLSNLFVAAALVVSLDSGTAKGADFFWDGLTGGAWELPTNWSTASTGGTDPLSFPNSATADTANFNVSGTNTPMVVNLNGTRAVNKISVTSAGLVTF